MKTKFIYLLIIVFSISLTSCRKQRKAEKGLVGTWDVTGSGYSTGGTFTGTFYLDEDGNGYMTLFDENEIKFDVQIRDLDIIDHRNHVILGIGHWHFYQGYFINENDERIDFDLLDNGINQKRKITTETSGLEMDLYLNDINNTEIRIQIDLIRQ